MTQPRAQQLNGGGQIDRHILKVMRLLHRAEVLRKGFLQANDLACGVDDFQKYVALAY